MKPVIRYQSRLLFRKSYKPKRIVRIRPGAGTNLVFRPVRAGPESIGVLTQAETCSRASVDFD